MTSLTRSRQSGRQQTVEQMICWKFFLYRRPIRSARATERPTRRFFIRWHLAIESKWHNAVSSVTRYWSKNIAQLFPKVAQIVTTAFLHEVILFKNSPKSHQSFEATFVIKFVPKNFQKSPNLVTMAYSSNAYSEIHSHELLIKLQFWRLRHFF